MLEEKRRFFRINETIGLTYEFIDGSGDVATVEQTVDIWSLVAEQDERIEKLLVEAAEESPKTAALVRAFNQKLERIVRLLVVESRLVDRIADRIKEVNISACGIGFIADQRVEVGTRLNLEIKLFPGETIIMTKGRVVACEAEADRFYWRIDFFDMSRVSQEKLIQHIVQRQSVQLKETRNL